MPTQITAIKIKNYRSLANVSAKIGSLNILFGPNGAGKSSFLDTIWFVRDCAIRSVELASSARSHGIGILYDGATEGEPISITLSTEEVEYELLFSLSSGRIEPFAGERLHSTVRNATLIERRVGSDKAAFYHANVRDHVTVNLREPEKLSMGRYLDFDESVEEAADFDRLMHYVHFYHSRSLRLDIIKQKGSESGHELWLRNHGANLWSVLRNLHDRSSKDERYETIMSYMKKSFPSFDGIVLEQIGSAGVYASFLEKGRRGEIRASGVSDGHLQMLFLLTALFSENRSHSSLILFDEPEVSLHPWAISVFAEAVKHATEKWNKQVLIATHSPVLLSQFTPEHILTAVVEGGCTEMRRLSDIESIRDLLEQYAVGSLYMAQMIAAQSNEIQAGEEGSECLRPE